MRFISPSFLSFTLLMTLLPWVEIRCEQRGAAPFRLTYPVVEQNAFQVALGDVKFDPFSNPALRNRGGMPAQGQVKQKQPDIPPAPIIGAFLVCVLMATIIGFAVPMRKARLALMTVFTLGAGGTILAQVLLGFPLLKNAQTQQIFNFMDELGINDPQLRGPEISFSPGYTIWFYLALIGVVGGVAGVLVDFLNPPALRRPWEEEYDDRPRRRRRRRDDDYYDDDYDDDDRGPRDRGGPRNRGYRDRDDR